MSTLKVANIHFEATGTNRVEYVANNINFRMGGGNFTVSVGGAESLNINTSSVMVQGANLLASVAAAATSANLTSAWGTANSAVQTTRNVSAGGIATGGGDLSADRTITVTKATGAEVTTGTDDTHAVTPKALADAGIKATKLIHVREEQTSGTAAAETAGLGASAEITRTLNTVVTNEVTGASLSSNRITIPAGTYEVFAEAGLARTNNTIYHRLGIYDYTNSAYLVKGTTTGHQAGGSSGGVNVLNMAMLLGDRFTVAGTVQIELRHINTTYATTAGYPSYSGTPEIYSQVMLRKVA